MATQSNTGFHHHGHHHHQAQAISFQSGASALENITVPGNNYYNDYHGSSHGIIINASNSLMTTAGTATGVGSIVYSGTPPPSGGAIIGCSNNNNNLGISQPASSLGSLLLETVPGLKHEAGLAVEWSVEEQYKLEEGLVKFADEPTIMKYIKIAAVLQDKTVRDVALRCRWMMDRMEACLKTNMSSASPAHMAAYTIPLQPCDQNDSTSPIPVLIGTTKHRLEENNQALARISANLTTFKLQDNVDLFLRTRSSLISILNDMRNMPGIMSQMPPLPVFINEELASSILPSSAQCMMFGSSNGIHPKQEPGC
ncbi:hypothetical protein ACH5RR_029518 [Cinchona calisaya]|uniref:Uncharacterized protein n=1 Tax=Cinchona calisaya TaxID=153742 RepID=A0ABD2YRW7_9GENT